MNFRYIFMPVLLATILTVFPSCTKDGNGQENSGQGDLTYDEALSMQATFPELDSFMPEPDVPSQGKSAKRGVCTNFRINNMPELLGSGVTWCYNWSHNPLSEDRWAMLQSNGMVCLPMVWNAGYTEENLATFLAHDPAANYVLAYNEPNLTDQANMTPAQAAEHWPDFVASAKRLGLKIVGPAVNYGTLPGYGDPVTWYDEFLTYPGVSLDDMDAIALHCYMPNGNAVKTINTTNHCGSLSSRTARRSRPLHRQISARNLSLILRRTREWSAMPGSWTIQALMTGLRISLLSPSTSPISEASLPELRI